MPNMTITEIDQGGVVIGDSVYSDETLVFAAEHTYLKGTIFARHDSNNKLIPFVPGGSSNGNGTPKVVLDYEVSRASAGDTPCRALVAGKVRQDKLVIDEDGDGSNITPAILDQLRDYGIVTQPVAQLAAFDNTN
jgi:hypothetical protein